MVKIRAAEPEDFRAIGDIYNSFDITNQTGMLPYNSYSFWQKMLQNMQDPTRHKLVAVLDDVVVGVLDLSSLSNENNHIGMLGMAVHAQHQRKGIGQALLTAAIEVADNWMGLLKLELYVYTDNAPAVALYKKFGFEVEGTRRMMALRGGVYKDAFAMGRLRPAPAV